MNQNRTVWHLAIGLSAVGLLVMPAGAVVISGDRPPLFSQPPLPTPSNVVDACFTCGINNVNSQLPTPDSPLPTPRLARFSCPTEIQPLTTALLRDLPGYINRSNSRLAVSQAAAPSYAVVASQPDFTPLPTGSSEYQSPPDKNLHQVFFTVLERQYAGKRVIEFQQFHWLFLAQTTDGWRLALLFSRIGSYPGDRQPLTPPRESSESATGEAIRAWLRNCEAGSIKP